MKNNDGNSETIKNALAILTAIIVLIGTFVSFFNDHPRLGVIFIFLLITIALLFFHIKRRVKYSEITQRKETVFLFSKEIRNGASIILVILLWIANLIHFLPPSNTFFQSMFWPTISPTVTALISPTLTTVPIITDTPAPLQITPTITITSSPANTYTWYDFRENCIPAYKDEELTKKAWEISSPKLSIVKEECLFSDDQWSFIPHDKELEIFTTGQPKAFSRWLIINVPDEAESISFSVDISALSNANVEFTSSFFYGFFEKEIDSSPSGQFIIYVNKHQDAQIGYILRDTVGWYSKKSVLIAKTHSIYIDLRKKGYMTVQLDDTIPPELKNIPIKSRNFVFGYRIPIYGNLNMTIKDFKILPE
jgi:hypothetical protein